MLASAAKQIKSKQKNKKIPVKEKKLGCALIQNGKILVIFICLQAKSQLFQEYRALFENFLAVVRKKLCGYFAMIFADMSVFTLEFEEKKFSCPLQKLLMPYPVTLLWRRTWNMVPQIDIDDLKI